MPALISQKWLTLEIRIAAETIAEEVHHFATFARGDVAFADCLLGEAAEAADEFLGVILYVAEYVGHGIAFDFVRVNGFAVFHVNADYVGIT